LVAKCAIATQNTPKKQSVLLGEISTGWLHPKNHKQFSSDRAQKHSLAFAVKISSRVNWWQFSEAARENSRPIFAHDENDTISALRIKNAVSVINYNACARYFWGLRNVEDMAIKCCHFWLTWKCQIGDEIWRKKLHRGFESKLKIISCKYIRYFIFDRILFLMEITSQKSIESVSKVDKFNVIKRG
jgi:hypothetical protein